MIGAFVAAYFIGKRPIIQSLVFWFAVLVSGFLLAQFGTLIISLIIGIIIFFALAIFYLKVNIKIAVIMYIVAFVINIAITTLIGTEVFQYVQTLIA